MNFFAHKTEQGKWDVAQNEHKVKYSYVEVRVLRWLRNQQLLDSEGESLALQRRIKECQKFINKRLKKP